MQYSWSCAVYLTFFSHNFTNLDFFALYYMNPADGYKKTMWRWIEADLSRSTLLPFAKHWIRNAWPWWWRPSHPGSTRFYHRWLLNRPGSCRPWVGRARWWYSPSRPSVRSYRPPSPAQDHPQNYWLPWISAHVRELRSYPAVGSAYRQCRFYQ